MHVSLATVSQLRGLILEGGLRVLFQPIVDLVSGAVLGHEALLRGPRLTPLESADELFRVARYSSMERALEAAAAVLAVRRYAELDGHGQLCLNLSAPALCAFAEDGGGALLHTALDAGLGPARLVIELTDQENIREHEALAAAVHTLTGLGMRFALDNFGDGHARLRLWAQLRPSEIKLGRYFAHGIHADGAKAEALRAICQLAHGLDTRVTAVGVEDAADLLVLRDLGCHRAQGYFIGAPEAVLSEAAVGAVEELLKSSKIAILPGIGQRPDDSETVERLLLKALAVERHTPNEELLRLFNQHQDLHAVAVVDHSAHPVGLINRRAFLDRYAQPFHRELYGRRDCCLFMNAEPLVVEKGVSIDSLISVLTGDDQRYLYDGFVITEAGRYVGVATGESLVRAVTERRVEAARHANPLTLLPGNIPITEHIRRLLGNAVSFAACYFDLNNFKPYNDLYGYWRGDEMIKLLAATLAEHCDPTHDFLGHVGGDDFVVLFQSEDWQTRCEATITAFNARARSLFDPEEIARGGMEGEDRRGFATFFPLTTVAAGMVEVRPGVFRDPEAVASAAAAAKKIAKAAGSGLHLLQGVHSWSAS